MLLLSDLTIRLGQVEDLPFIMDSWTKTMHQTYPNQHIPDFEPKFHAQLDHLLHNATVLVSCLDTNPAAIISYLVYTSFRQQLVVYYAYTRPGINGQERRQGFLNQLLQFANPTQSKVIFTFPAKNENVMKYLSNKYIFDPFLLSLLGAK